jgi:CheY-like chemotaxis protein
MGGVVWLESEVGRGSRFHFTVRLGLSEKEARLAPRVESTYLYDLPVLVVDDSVTNRRILEEVLASWRMAPASVSSAGEAMQLLREAFRAGRPYALVLTDAHMPDCDGFAFAEQVRRDREVGSTVIMMLTSGDRPGDAALCQQLRISNYLLKPVKSSELLDAILAALGVTMAEERPAEGAVTKKFAGVPPLRILLAEDSVVNQKLATALLQREGHHVVLAGTGREAVAAAESQAFDLALMDVQMPEMDGLEATAAIRVHEAQRGGHLPIIAMTAHALKGDRQRCLDAGMDQYLAKPIHAGQLFAMIKATLGIACEAEAPPQSPAPETGDLNWAEIQKAIGGDRQLVLLVVETALREIPALMSTIEDAIHRQDATSLRLTAHTLKGSIRYFGATPAFDVAYELEQMGQQNDLRRAEESVAALRAALDPLLQALTAYQGRHGKQAVGSEE